ncbi:unnamed protein product [Moneuplotes crassus]|uniref:Uncharacterized protein n=1 Tax=Euplotes crassus TaxID=5936 RepID=A0AAD1X9J7_EUPCR|nr:unnamed protein product [Moneuplotes crassus]
MGNPERDKTQKNKVKLMKTIRSKKDYSMKHQECEIRNIRSFSSFYKLQERKQKVEIVDSQKNTLMVSEVNLALRTKPIKEKIFFCQNRRSSRTISTNKRAEYFPTEFLVRKPGYTKAIVKSINESPSLKEIRPKKLMNSQQNSLSLQRSNLSGYNTPKARPKLNVNLKTVKIGTNYFKKETASHIKMDPSALLTPRSTSKNKFQRPNLPLLQLPQVPLPHPMDPSHPIFSPTNTSNLPF